MTGEGAGGPFVGRALWRVEDCPLLMGRGCFTADLPAALYVRFVRSPVAAGRIVGIDAPEDCRIFTAADLDGVAPIRPMLRRFGYIPIAQPILAREVVRYMGEPVAVVLAETEERAEDFAEMVVLRIEETVPVVTPAAAMAAGAPRVHSEVANNIVVNATMATPGLGAARDAAHRIVSATVRSRRQSALPIEPRAAHAAFDAATGRVVLTCTTQMPHLTRTAIADLLNMPESGLRVIAPDIGGGFGQKMSLAAEYVVLVWLARRYRTSIAWIEDRRDNLMASFHSRDIGISVDGAFNADGRLLALEGDVVANCGAYAPFPNTAAVEPLMAFAELPGPYDVAEYRCVARGVLTNTCVSAPYRGVARPAITLAIERLMDKAAAELGIDPVEIRRRNLVARFPHVSPTGLVYDQATYRETLDAAMVAADLPGFRARQASARREGRHLGVGIATFCERTGYGSPAFAARGMDVVPGWETVEITMDPSGTVEARIGASPHGQGLRTTLAQIIADAIGTVPGRIGVVHGDTDRTPYGWGTFASRSLVISGGAALLAGRKLHDKLLRVAAEMLEAAEADIDIVAGIAQVRGTDRTIAVDLLARAAWHQAHRFGTDFTPGLVERGHYDPAGTFSNATHVAFVEVDIATGAVKVQRFIVAEDAGRLINPMIVDGQIAGGVAQGIGNALLEEIVYDEAGNMLSATLADFLPPTVHEIPPIEILHRETISPETVTGAKGLGEGGTIGAPAAIVNAINDALSPFAVAIDEMPATPMRIRAALRAAGGVA
ncbi:MAG: xanthine dehydrogenase family protein molybdopterin-binding subunit [Acidiphilium sp.]